MKNVIALVSVAAAMLASSSVAFADDSATPPAPQPPSPPSSAAQSPSAPSAPSASTTTTTEVQTPTNPPMTTTATTTTTTTTTNGAPPAQMSTSTTTGDEPAGTTTTTSSDATTTSAPLSTTPIDRARYTIDGTRRPHRALAITGASIFVASYAATAIANGAYDGPDKALYIPVAGPWMHLADREGTEGQTPETLLVGASGVLQGAGLGLVIASVIIPERVPIATISAGHVKMAVTPTSPGRGGAGVGVGGTF